ncbi:MAG: endonuclease/exonuclease/phosphatase family protein [Pyrinomonadaceae bacterium]
MPQKLRPFRTRRRRQLRLALAVACLSLALLPFPGGTTQADSAELFTFDELSQLYEEDQPSASLREKLQTILSTPFVSNAATERGVRPLKPTSRELGRYLRVAQWNIERGLEFEAIRAAFTDKRHFAQIVNREKYAHGTEAGARMLREATLLKAADVIVINEVDWGMKRTGYRHIAADLAAALNMNYAYGVEFVEIDPLLLGTEDFEGAGEKDRTELESHIKVDPARYKGLHGTAILSRYKLENVRLVPFKFQGHDWYADEKKGTSPIEFGKRALGEKIFLEKVTREIRRGGRMMLVAEISDPDLPTGRAVIVATHLEARTAPKNRVKQLEEVLAYIRSIEHPVILAGDMNTSTSDQTPTSLKREIKKRLGDERFWIEQGIKYATGVGLVLDVVKGGLGFSRTHADPTVRSIKFIAENPEAKFFETLKDFRFTDGGAFDFRGERARSANGRGGNLANSNERAGKGFQTTYAVDRTIGPTGKLKLDWIFVKPPALTDPEAHRQPYRFAPHFGRALSDLNNSLKDRISDHVPITVDLPFEEPHIRARRAKD